MATALPEKVQINKPIILFVDDNENFRDDFKRSFEENKRMQEYDLVNMPSAQEAIRYLHAPGNAEKVALILTDQEMFDEREGSMHGPDFVKALQKDDRLVSIPVVAHSTGPANKFIDQGFKVQNIQLGQILPVAKDTIPFVRKKDLMFNDSFMEGVVSTFKRNVDSVMLKGGIDFNKIAIQRHGKKVNVQFDPAQLSALEQGGFEGFTPVITGFQYIKSPFPLLGINTTN
jgi:CheY-like chemotaxis protein